MITHQEQVKIPTHFSAVVAKAKIRRDKLNLQGIMIPKEGNKVDQMHGGASIGGPIKQTQRLKRGKGRTEWAYKTEL